MREYTPDCPAHNQLCIRSKDNYKAMQHVVAFELAQVVPNIEPYLTHVKTYIDRIDYMKKLFEAGRDKQTVKDAITNLHRPEEYWEQKAKDVQAKASGTK